MGGSRSVWWALYCRVCRLLTSDGGDSLPCSISTNLIRATSHARLEAVYMFDKVFANFSLLTSKNLHKKKMHVN
jgi:hypothetical protein